MGKTFGKSKPCMSAQARMNLRTIAAERKLKAQKRAEAFHAYEEVKREWTGEGLGKAARDRAALGAMRSRHAAFNDEGDR